MKVFNLIARLSLIALYSAPTFGDVCSSASCPKGRTPTTICFSDPSTNSEILKADAAANCGYFTEIINVTSNEQIKSHLSKMARECKTIDRMNFQGHGTDGYQATGELDSGTVKEFSSFSCLFNKGASIGFYGCSVGQGCAGDMLLYQTAKSFLGNGGTVKAPTWYSSSFLPGIIPSFSLNGKSRQISYTPSKNPSDSWTQTGFAITNGGDINDRCSDNLKSLIDDYSSTKNSAKKKNCSANYDYVSDDRIESYKKMQSKLSVKPPPYLQSANSDSWYDLSLAINALKYQIRRYEQCEPTQSDRSNSRSSGAVR